MSDTLTVNFSGDIYPTPSGFPIADVRVDGISQPAVTVTAIHSEGQVQPVEYTVPAAASHTVKVYFSNDDYGGPTQDRNLYAACPGETGVQIGGKATFINNTATMDSTGDFVIFTVPGSVGADSYPDGSSEAPAEGPNTFQNATFFSGYKARPAWRVAGVDYPVGISGNPTLTDWQKLSLPGVSVNVATGLIEVGQDGVTFENVDFSMHGGIMQVYINANNVAFVGCKFGGPNQTKQQSGLLYQVNGKGGFKFWYNWVDGGNSPPVSGAEQTFLLAGSGDFTVRWNYFVNYPAQVVQVQNGPCTLDYQFNFIDSGSIASGAHENWLQASMEGTWTPTVQYNCGIQTRAGLNGWTGGGGLWQFLEGNPGPLKCTVNNPVFANNVVVASPVGVNIAANQDAVGWIASGSTGTVADTTLTGTGTVSNNYLDASGAFYAFYPKSMEAPGWTGSGNIDMNTGDVIPLAT